MEVTCESCKTKLNIPDEKIPEGQMFRVSCRKCKQKITIDPRKAYEGATAPEGAAEGGAETGKFHRKFNEKTPPPAPEGEDYGYDEYNDDKDLDFVEEGTKLAIILDTEPARLEKIKTAVEKLGYKCIFSPNTRDATGKMRFHHFDLVVVSDGFDGQPLDQNPLLNFLNRMSMSVRRHIFLALMSDRFKTMDNMMAFALSANLVVNINEMDRLGSILQRAISENEKFYKVYMDSMTEAGKA